MTPVPAKVTARRPLTDAQRSYAESKLARLARHTQLHDLNMVIDENGHAPPSCTVEIVIHLHHTRLVARATAVTLQEAVDLAVDRADRQALRRKDRVTHRKGHVGADGVAGPAFEEPTSL